jgi:acetolactate synthase-1/2/3 large subunit
MSRQDGTGYKEMVTNADRIVGILMESGVRRLFGMPGGGSSADIIEAANRAGLPFSLSQTECGSAFMACAQAEITGDPGACIATLGPGAASLMNGVATAHLERVPLIVITDCWGQPANQVMQHQNLSHGEMFSSVTKCTVRLPTHGISDVLRSAVTIACSLPPGPVHVDVSAEVTAAIAEPAEDLDNQSSWPSEAVATEVRIPEHVQRILRTARRPIFLVGLGARTVPISLALEQMCERFCIPALVTYKAKGVVPDRNPWFGGVLTNGALEREVLEHADVFIAIGLDPVELLPRPWKFAQPVISITSWPMNQKQIPFYVELVGDVVAWLELVAENLPRNSDWEKPELLRLVERQREAMRPSTSEDTLQPYRVVELVAEAYPAARVTVDAGAHMFPVMSLWNAEKPCSILISNGLSTMGFALPAAIGAALLDTSQPVVCFTGDGGLLMCLAELRTAAREGLLLRIIVFDDAALSLIKAKQIQRGYATTSTDIGATDWELVGAGLGLLARKAQTAEALRTCLIDTASHLGPVLIAAQVNPQTYSNTIVALRG